ncbi:uncharacterized protein BYT42DRAFT_579577 [Radiomyces spectabilis]|uniref:uncharacterized protein n=1 Tax=Radiomyces spectabilis TaxID=64574 RepID=UPI00221FFBA7|nr:uncharacterized protein BYT42DRAFT_579577 [Radiomyces spectabilis]KAI8373205.1 hypothetical protein BYT42DRAFT_579577 [Radiomyces spectabilis]
MLFLLSNLVGTVVQVTVKNGSKFEGVFHSASTQGELDICLKLARKIHDPQAPPLTKGTTNPNPIKPSLIIFSKDLVEINAADTDLTAGDMVTEKDTFKTDTDISGRMEIRERELHKWNPEGHEAGAFDALEGDLESPSQGSGSWDQFAANEKLFGLKTDFDEEIYTTKLDRSAPDFKDREKKAMEKAAEIQKSSAATTNVHLLEERGLLDDSNIDEEDRYGAVVRDVNPNRYMPPALRKQMQQASPSGKKKDGADDHEPTMAKSPSTNLPPNSPLHKLMTNSLPKIGAQAASPVANLANIRQDTRSPNAQPPMDKLTEGTHPKRIEAEIATTFRQFALQEKDKLHAKKQALQKKEKDSRLAELMKFHQSFRLDMPVPPDLAPLLSKGKRRTSPTEPGKSTSPSPSETKKPAVASSPLTGVTTDENKENVEPASTKPKPLSDADQSPEPKEKPTETKPVKPANSAFKFNVKASEFKPNPTAPAFVPGGGARSTTEASSPFFAGRQLKRGVAAEPLVIAEAFTPSFSKGKDVPANSVGPTWPFGTKQYRHQFHQFAHYDDDVFTGYPSPNFPYGYPPYRYPQQFIPGMSPIPVQQPNHVPYMSPQFVPNVPISAAQMPPTGAPPAVAYSPQMANVSPHGSPFPQGFPSPQRSPMAPHGMPPQVYQYQGNVPHQGPMMMRHPAEMMPPNPGPGGPVMVTRPMMVDANHMPYPPSQETTSPSPESVAEPSPSTYS